MKDELFIPLMKDELLIPSMKDELLDPLKDDLLDLFKGLITKWSLW